MRNIFSIARKEWVLYFSTPWAYAIFTSMAFLSSYFFVNMLDEFQRMQQFAREVGPNQIPQELRNLTDGVIGNVFQFLMIVTLFFAPFLSMRLLAEERRNKTFELLFTCPIRPIELVVGKYLGGLVPLFSVLSLSLVFPWLCDALGLSDSGHPVEWRTVLLAFLGLLLWAATCMATGLFFSSLTESQMLASVLTFTVLLPWMMLSWLAESASEPLRAILNYLSFQAQLEGMIHGTLRLSTLVYFGTIILFALALTQRSVEAQRWTQ